MKILWRTVLAILLMLVILVSPTNVYSCGPFFPSTVFVHKETPDLPMGLFLQGKLGIVQKEYSSLPLFVAYRYFIGKPLSEKEQALLTPSNFEKASSWMPSNGYQEWLYSRAKVIGSTSDPQYPLEAEVQQDSGRSYEFYLNINDDAFQCAAETLDQRISQFGAQSREVADWVHAQDDVFSSQKTGKSPPPADPSLPTIIQRDRSYQSAAAQFYMCRFNTAESLFTAIQQDRSSQWSKLARYLVARTIIRRATLTSANQDSLLERASDHLRAILNDRNTAALHAAARRLLNFCMFRTEPEALFFYLDHRIMAPSVDSMFHDEWSDYVKLLHLMADSTSITKSDFADWLESYCDGGNPRTFDHSFKRWLATKSPAWLVASLASVSPSSPELNKLFKATETVSKSSCEYSTVMYWKIRLLVEAGKKSEARKLIEVLRDKDDITASISNTNLVNSERAQMTNSYEEFLQYCHQRPYGQDWGEGEIRSDKDSSSLFTPMASALNRFVPLRLLDSACWCASLPPNLRSSIIRATWVRAFLVDDQEISLHVAPLLANTLPDMKPFLEQFQSATDNNSRRFAGAYFLLEFPGLQPYIRIGTDRSTSLDAIDDYRDNWWYSNDFAIGASAEDVYVQSETFSQDHQKSLDQPPSFLTGLDKTTAERETKKLTSLFGGPTYLGGIVNNYALSHRQDARVPEALYLTVRATRYGCHDSLTTMISKEAFQQLHKYYSESTWAKRTKYYY